jgi:glycosyltransferase involved in cell wall biosynthesis
LSSLTHQADCRMAEVDIIVPIFNEGASLSVFHALLISEMQNLGRSWRVVYVNDGSHDNTQELLAEICAADARITALELSRNFGHQAALTAGLDHADADIIIMMDGDGQHPPELIHEMLRLCDSGYEIVQTQRVDVGGSAGVLKRTTAVIFYWLLNRIGEIQISQGAADFRLITRNVWAAVQGVREYHRFLRGITSWVGFRTVILPYRPRAREHGTSKYSLKKMLRLAGAGLFSFSLLPLRIGLVLGSLLAVIAVLEASYIAILFLIGRRHLLVPGWSSLVLLVTISSSILMILIGIIGVYTGMIFQEVKRRPIYILRHAKNPDFRTFVQKVD